jgi:hypothetical protein
MRDATGESPDRLQFLRLPEPLLALAQVPLRRAALGKVVDCRATHDKALLSILHGRGA